MALLVSYLSEETDAEKISREIKRNLAVIQ
jgi:hypothetical protein